MKKETCHSHVLCLLRFIPCDPSLNSPRSEEAEVGTRLSGLPAGSRTSFVQEETFHHGASAPL